MDPNPITYSDENAKFLAEFSQQSVKQLPDKAFQIVVEISKTGLTCYTWEHLKHILAIRLAQVLDEHNAKSAYPDFEALKGNLVRQLNTFAEPPFTIQRICELLVRPQAYSTTKKFLFAIDKVLNVTSVQPTLPAKEFNEAVAQQHQKMQEIRAANNAAAAAQSAAEQTADGTSQPTADTDVTMSEDSTATASPATTEQPQTPATANTEVTMADESSSSSASAPATATAAEDPMVL